MPILRNIMVGCGVLVSSFLTALYVLQEKILYLPSIPTRDYERTPDDYNMQYVDVELRTDDDVQLHAWLITQHESAEDAPTLLYFHGNAGNMSHRLIDVRFHYASGYNVLLVSYRGYGRSQGAPSQHGFQADARAAFAYLRDRSDIINQNKLFVFGRSIGGACAIDLVATHSDRACIKGLIVENTFTSIDDMIDVVLPILKFAKPLNRNKWNSLKAVKNIKIPILFLRYVL